jgi:hypothetical protein
MQADVDNIELFLLSTDKDGVWHFRLVCPNFQIDFDAIQEITTTAIVWKILRICIFKTTNANKGLTRLFPTDDCSVFSLVTQALSDFGAFFGEKTEDIQISIIAKSCMWPGPK